MLIYSNFSYCFSVKIVEKFISEEREFCIYSYCKNFSIRAAIQDKTVVTKMVPCIVKTLNLIGYFYEKIACCYQLHMSILCLSTPKFCESEMTCSYKKKSLRELKFARGKTTLLDSGRKINWVLSYV